MSDVIQIESGSETPSGPAGPHRRGALLTLLGGGIVAGLADSARAEIRSSVDMVPLQFALQLQYLVTNYLNYVIFGEGQQLPAQLIRAGEIFGEPGVVATNMQQVKFPSASERILLARIREMANTHWYQTLTIRDMLRGDSVAQPEIDYRPEAFTAMLRLAGAIGQNETFSPYESPVNCLIGAEMLLSVQASAIAPILGSMTNELAMAVMISMGASAASNVTSVRSMLYDLSASTPNVLTILDKLAAWRDRVDGTSTTDRGFSPTAQANGQTAARLTVIDRDGLYIGRTPQQALNILFMTSASVTQGGFYPKGITGGIVRSAAN